MNKNHDITIPQVDIKQLQVVQNEQDDKLSIPLNGKLIISTDPILIGDNFRTIVNMRYVPGHPEGILGMTKININRIDSSYYKPRSAFHFLKTQPDESHILVQVFDTSFTSSKVFDNETTAPNQGEFSPTSLWTDSLDPISGVPNIGRFSDAPNGQMAYCNGVESCIWGGNEMHIGALITSTSAVGTDARITNPVDFSDRMQNIKTDQDNICVITTNRVLMIGSVRPLKGIKPYILPGYGNTTASNLSLKEWTGSAWTTKTITSDGTSYGGAALARTGLISFSSTVNTSKPIFINGYFLYWYQLTLSAGGTYIYTINVDAPVQKIQDLWDGKYRSVAACYYRTSTYFKDLTIDVSKIDFDFDIPETYMDRSNSEAFSDPNNCIEVGFAEKQTGIYFLQGIKTDSTGNGANYNVAAMSIDYWDGHQYLSVGAISDSTSSLGRTLRLSGVVSWTNVNIQNEVKTTKSSSITTTSGVGSNVSTPLYFYRIRWDAQLSGAVYIDYMAGVPAQKSISGYSFPILAADRLMLGCDTTGRKNSLLISAENKYNVFNGDDSFSILFGDDKPLTCGTSIFAQYASNIYNMALIFKKTELWSLVWQQGTSAMEWIRFKVSPNVGCPAPGTLKTISAAFGNDIGAVKVIAIWRADDGIYISNGQAPLKVSSDLDPIFDQSNALHVNSSMVKNEIGFVDEHLLEYHWCWASGENTYLDKEYVLDLKTWKWFEVDRTANNHIQVGIETVDFYGNNYTYGLIDTGYMERLEYGTTFDGQPITHILETGDISLVKGDVFMETSVVRANLIAIAKNTDSSVTLTHTTEGSTSGTSYDISVLDASHRNSNSTIDMFSEPAIFHSFKLVSTTSSETKGFCPLLLSIYYHKERDKVA